MAIPPVLSSTDAAWADSCAWLAAWSTRSPRESAERTCFGCQTYVSGHRLRRHRDKPSSIDRRFIRGDSVP